MKVASQIRSLTLRHSHVLSRENVTGSRLAMNPAWSLTGPSILE
jgi:hypothetical protein